VELGREKLRTLAEAGGFAEGHVPWQAIMEQVMGDRQRVDNDSQLPDTGMPVEIERALSPIFVGPTDVVPVLFPASPERCSHYAWRLFLH
jgi:uncharacterized protein with NRDE domain